MKTTEELLAMPKEELIKQVESDQFMSGVYEKENKRLRDILSAIGIVYETYKNEYVKH